MNSPSISLVRRRSTTVSLNNQQFIWAPLRNEHWVSALVQIKFLQAVYRSRTHCRMAQCKGTTLKMEEWSTSSNVIKGSVSRVLTSFIVTKDSGMALHQAVSQKVSISESCSPLHCKSERSVLALKKGLIRWVKYSPIFESNLAPLNQGQYSPIS